MRPGHRFAGRSSAIVHLAMGLIALSCRIGYETLPHADGSGVAGSAAAAAAGNGGSPGSSGSPSGGADGAGTSSDLGGAPTASAGALGDAGRPSAGGAPSAGPCQTTADCTCDELDGQSYWLCAAVATGEDAAASCQTQGMTLVRIDSQAENDALLGATAALRDLSPDGFLLIGATDQAVEGEWRWQDGTQFWQGASNGMPVDGQYSNWFGSSPSSNGVRACAGMLTDGTWQDRSCTAEAPYVCESP